MREQNKGHIIYLMNLILVAVFAISFVSAMGFLNYRSAAISQEEKVIARVEKDMVTGMESAISFGKSFENFYGMEDIFASFEEQYPGPEPFVMTKDGKLLYYMQSEDPERMNGEDVIRFLESDDFLRELPGLESRDGEPVVSGKMRAVFAPIHQGDEVIGYFGSLYRNGIFGASFSGLIRQIVWQAVFFAVIECLAFFFFVSVVRSPNWLKDHRRKSDRNLEKGISVFILGFGILLLSALTLYTYQRDYRDRIENSIRVSLRTLEQEINHVREQGVDLRKVDGMKEYIEDRVSSLDTLHAVRVTEYISEVKRTDEESDLISFTFGSGTDGEALLRLEAEISQESMNREMRTIILVLLSTMIILMIFVVEMNNLVELSTAGTADENQDDGFSEEKVGLALRFTGFLCSTAEYMCVPYAAMMIRASGESLFGLSVGMTAALPLTLEGFTQMIGMLVLPRFVKKFNVRVILVISTIVMVACNVSAFWFGGAMVILICRAIAGIAYAGFKQVSNFLITTGYETETGRSENISQDNAGLLAGATCGAGLGAILSSNAGYGITFLFSACVFVVYLLVTYWMLPWRSLSRRKEETEEKKPIRLGGLLRMFLSPEMLFFILVIGIPLNIGVMLCVTLIPAICQTRGISSVMLSYCYIANGIAGIYIGPGLVAKAKARFGLAPCISFAFALTAVGIFILRIPPVLMMIVISSMILGFLDGFGTPMVTDRFMSLRIVENAVDESTSLIFYVVLSYILLTFAPMIAELLLLPEKGAFSPMLIGGLLYAAAAVLVFFFREHRKT